MNFCYKPYLSLVAQYVLYTPGTFVYQGDKKRDKDDEKRSSQRDDARRERRVSNLKVLFTCSKYVMLYYMYVILHYII